MINSAKKFLTGIEEINYNAKNKSLWESIDRPIRPLVYHMNRLGYKTRYSCCGYSYSSEEEPKSHSCNAFVQFHPPGLNDLNFIIYHAKRFGFKEFDHLGANLWIIRSPVHKEWGDPGSHEFALHSYETKLCAVHDLTKYLQEIKGGNPDFILEDGNGNYGDEWMIKPHEPAKASEYPGEPKVGV